MSVASPSQRGLAVINALVIVLASSIIATALIERQTRLSNELITEHDATQAYWLLSGALNWTTQLLAEDARGTTITVHNGLWAQAIERLPIRDERSTAYFSGYLQDEQAKYNLLRLQQDGQRNPTAVAQLQELLHAIQLPAKLADDLALQITAMQTNGTKQATQPGARLPSELIAAQSLSPTQRTQLNQYTTLLPENTALNVNTASAYVLSAYIDGLTLADALRIVAARDQGLWFRQLSDFTALLPTDAHLGKTRLQVKSQWFSAHGKLELKKTQRQFQALLERGSHNTYIRWIL